MTEKLPNWNLGDFYSSINDEGIDLDLKKYRNFSKSFNKKYKGQLVNQAQNLESIIKEYEDGNELGDKIGNFAFLIYATNMNDQETVQFYQGINEKLTEISSNLIFFTNEINATNDPEFEKFLSNAGKYKNWLINIRRYKQHQLDEKSEMIFLDKNLTSNSSWVRFFEEQINDLKFKIDDKDLNSSEALNLLSDHKSTTRKKAAKSIEDVFKSNVKTFSFITNTLAKDKITNAPYFLPYLTGERTPINDPHVRASFHQMGIDSDRASLIYALIEGISFGLNNNYQALSKTGIKLENIYAIGGGSKNESWLKLLASILNRNLSLTDASDAMAAFGAARIAFMGFNNLKPNEALSSPKVIKIIEKDPSLFEILNERFQIWNKFYIRNE